jgi:hypothetical protein
MGRQQRVGRQRTHAATVGLTEYLLSDQMMFLNIILS